VIKTDDLIDYFYIPYFITTEAIGVNVFHLQVALQFILTELDYARKIDYILLIVAMTKKMALIRKSTLCEKDEISDLLSAMWDVLYKFPEFLESRAPTSMMRKLHEYGYIIGNWLEPLDWAKMLSVNDKINVLHVIQNYETRCFPLHQKLRVFPMWKIIKTETEMWQNIDKFMYCERINRESLMRHMMLHATASEFKLYVYQLTKWYYHFGWINQLEAYENVVRIATDAIHLTLLYFPMFSLNAFYALLCALVKFCEMFAENSDANSYETICRILLKALCPL